MCWVGTAITILMGFAAVTLTCIEPVGVARAADWTVIWDDPAAYGELPGEEVLLRGELVVENYGKPGVKYVRAPLRYWLRTDGRAMALSPPRDSFLMPLDGRIVEVKGKVKPDPKGHDTLWVRLIRPVDKGPDSH